MTTHSEGELNDYIGELIHEQSNLSNSASKKSVSATEYMSLPLSDGGLLFPLDQIVGVIPLNDLSTLNEYEGRIPGLIGTSLHANQPVKVFDYESWIFSQSQSHTACSKTSVAVLLINNLAIFCQSLPDIVSCKPSSLMLSHQVKAPWLQAYDDESGFSVVDVPRLAKALLQAKV